jgi:hypothetical protein
MRKILEFQLGCFLVSPSQASGALIGLTLDSHLEKVNVEGCGKAVERGLVKGKEEKGKSKKNNQ